MKLCSGCLIGLECRYDGKSNIEKASPKLLEEFKRGEIIPVCPEQLGGLPTPRDGARIIYGKGEEVLYKKARLVTDNSNEDVTKQYIRGAYEALKIAMDLDITEVIFKQKSPSCGCGLTQGGEKRTTIKGDGVTTALFKQHGIKVYSNEEYK